MNIHPTAIVGTGAKLGANVKIGPYAIVDGTVTLGDDCVVQSHAVLTDRVTLGARNLVGHHAVIGAAPQDVSHNASISSAVIIGDDNIIREHATIHRGTKEGSATVVGNGNFLMAGVHIGHNSRIGHRNVMANNCLLAGYVEVADDVVFGGASVFHQFLRIGRMVMIRGGTAWSTDIPPFTIGRIINVLGGLNVVGMRRKGFDAPTRADIKRAFNLVYQSGRNLSQALDEARAMEWTPEASEFLEFIRGRGKRGLCRFAGTASTRSNAGED
jgi:UDP-N-acetylglucosamine acyltransferase